MDTVRGRISIPLPGLAKLQEISGYALSHLQPLAKRLVLSGLSGLSIGTLTIEGQDGIIVLGRKADKKVNGSGGQPEPPAAVLTVHDDFFWIRVLLLGDMGFAQSYMLHEISTSDLTTFFEVFIRNSSALTTGSTTPFVQTLLTKLGKIVRKANDIATARLNANAHYSLSNDMFAAFLSPDMTYSAPLWLPFSDPSAATETLEEAQMRKLRYAISSTRIKASDHVLEIGTGWGSFAILAASTTGCRVTTITPSVEQKKLVDRRIADAGLSSQIQVVVADYRELRPEQPFDKVVSIEMIEHVGHAFLETYFACVDRYLKTDGGIGYFQCITIPEARYAQYLEGEDFIKKYIFPGGHLPTVSGLVSSIDRGSKGKLVVEEIKSVGAHYVRALRCWNENFHANFEDKIVPALLERHPAMTRAEMDIFKRKWEYYFCYCEAGFKTKSLGDVAITVARENCVDVLEDVL
ncbi:Tuberculostearic acid methyltransferase UfaA1 [Pleurostoma richardsiae]|uniref:Tuberculostearic acid methyltransferase UfaA1 n=1 Tax=Pleurostoma richardsiae TaxID=41990 RepID=A0AA38RU37_9PEZI|nr:Tuberculostearic acid methyltransferase UfaA1 [Pleurostoma richardsiae]